MMPGCIASGRLGCVDVQRGEDPDVGLNAVAGRPKEEYGIEPTAFDEMRPGCWDIDERVKDMNAGGVLGSCSIVRGSAVGVLFCSSCLVRLRIACQLAESGGPFVRIHPKYS